MKRDMDIARKIIVATAELPYGLWLSGLDGITEEDFVMHVIWLMEADLIAGEALDGSGSIAKYAFVHRLTWAGCEFADAVASDTLWKKAKDEVIKPGLSFTFDVLKAWLKSEILQGFPTVAKLP